MEKVSTFKRAVNPKVRTHTFESWYMLARLKTDLAALCALFVEGHRRHHGKGKHWWEALSWIVINKRPLLSPFPQAERRDILYCWFFPRNQPPPCDPWKKMFIAYFRHWWWWLKNWLWTVQQHTMKWYYRIIEGEKWLLLLRVGQSFSLVIGDWISLLT